MDILDITSLSCSSCGEILELNYDENKLTVTEILLSLRKTCISDCASDSKCAICLL